MILSVNLAQMDNYYKEQPANLPAKMDTLIIKVYVKFVMQLALNAMEQRMTAAVLALMVTH